MYLEMKCPNCKHDKSIQILLSPNCDTQFIEEDLMTEIRPERKRVATIIDVVMSGGAKIVIGTADSKEVTEKAIQHAIDHGNKSVTLQNVVQGDYIDPTAAVTIILLLEKVMMISIATYIETRIHHPGNITGPGVRQ